MTMTPFLFVARIWKVLYHECIGKTILPQGLYLLIREIPRIFALSLALEMIQDSVEHLNSGFRSRGGKRGKLRFFCRVAQMDHPFFSSRFWKPR